MANMTSGVLSPSDGCVSAADAVCDTMATVGQRIRPVIMTTFIDVVLVGLLEILADAAASRRQQ